MPLVSIKPPCSLVGIACTNWRTVACDTPPSGANCRLGKSILRASLLACSVALSASPPCVLLMSPMLLLTSPSGITRTSTGLRIEAITSGLMPCRSSLASSSGGSLGRLWLRYVIGQGRGWVVLYACVFVLCFLGIVLLMAAALQAQGSWQTGIKNRHKKTAYIAVSR